MLYAALAVEETWGRLLKYHGGVVCCDRNLEQASIPTKKESLDCEANRRSDTAITCVI
jgi:hypothetical protein